MKKDRKIAIIDLGTNTFNLLIVQSFQSVYKTIYATRVGVGLGLGGINENNLADDAMDRGIETLKVYTEKCKELAVDEIHAYGTSAMRNARNNHVFIDRIKMELTLDIIVIDGINEALLIHKGVALGYPFDLPGVIMDIGGGSTEFIFANNQGIIKIGSFEIGAARIFELFDFSDPVSVNNIEEIENYLEEGVGAFFDDIQTDYLIGASGSFETFYELSTNSEYPADEFVALDRVEVEAVLDKIIRSTRLEREQNDRIISIRKKMAPIAAIKIRWIMRKLDIKKMVISPFAMKEGILHQVIKEGEGL